MVDISNAAHAVFGIPGNPNKLIVGFTRGLVFVMSSHFMHGGPSVQIIYIKNGLVSAEGSEWQNTIDHCLEIKT
jgi:hypothetical protein